MKELALVEKDPVWGSKDLKKLLNPLYRVYGLPRVHEGFMRSTHETTWGQLEGIIRALSDPDIRCSEIPLKHPEGVYRDPESERVGGLILGMPELDPE